MRTRACVAALLLVVGIGTVAHLSACGDKYLMIGLLTRYERSPAERQAAGILMYANTGSELARALSSLSVETALKKEHYKPTLVANATEFDTALRGRSWDVVVVDARDSQTVSQRVPRNGGPHIVPVLTRPTKDELSEAKKMYRTVVNTPTKSRAFVDTIEDAMDLHEAEVESAAKAAKKATH